MSNVAINRETGEILVIGPDGQWSPAPRAVNPQTGEQLFNDGTQWRPVPQAPAPAEPPPTALESLQRGAGLATRALGPLGAGMAAGAAMGAPFGGVGAIPGAIAGGTAAVLAEPVANLAVSAWNAATGQNRQMPSQAMQDLMTRAGLPTPQTPSERIASTTARTAAETLTGAGAARNVAQALSPVANPVARPVAQTLAAAPGMQTGAATAASGVTQGVLEAGAGPMLALPLGMAAGAYPAFRPGSLFSNVGGDIRAANIAAMTEAGIPTTPGQVSGNPSAQTFESVMRYLPTTAPTVARVEDQQMRAFTRNVLNRAGIDSDVATPEVLSKARQGFRQQYNALEEATPFRGDEQLFADLAGIEQNYVRGFQEFAPAWERMRDTVLDYAAGRRGDGLDYHRLQSRISEEIARASRSDAPSAGYWQQALQGLQKAIGDTMERSAGSPELRSAWNDVNRRYAIFSRIEDTMARAGQDKLNTGFIPPQQLAAVERVRNPQRWVEGGDDFTEFVRAGAAVLPDPIPNSGTAQRSFAQDLLTGGRRGAPVAAAGGAAQAAGLAALDPVLSLALPYAIGNRWYAPPMTREMQGLLGIQSLGGALDYESPR